MDYETFVNSAFLQQGRADAFTTKTPAQRKDILSDILGLERWRMYEERAKEELRLIEQQLSNIDYSLRDIERQEAEEPALLRDLEAAEIALADSTRLREQAEADYAEVAGAQEAMSGAQARLAQAQHRIKQRRLDLLDIEAEQARYQEQMDRLTGVIQQRETIHEGYAQLQAARAADQQLGEKLQVMSAIKDRLNDVSSRIQDARAALEAQASVHQDRLLDCRAHCPGS